MATKAKVVESSFRLGCGRYIQEDGAICRLGEELERLGAHTPFILGGPTALSLTAEALEASLSARGIEMNVYVYRDFCNRAHCEEIVQSLSFMDTDCVVGVGGGNVMDAAKLCAAIAGLPVINIPTSAATCAAYTPLSVTYNDRGQTVGTIHHVREVDVVLADMQILCAQPPRLLAAGIYDSLAKLIELRQRMDGQDESALDVGLLASYDMSRFLYERLLADADAVLDDVANARNTKRVYDTVFLILALTGVVSGLARGSNQTAIAHKVYETTRTLFPEQSRGALHGELVAIGLLVQLDYNGEPEQAEQMRERMQASGMPTALSQIGIPADAQTVNAYYEKIVASSAMNGTTDAEQARLRRCLDRLIAQ